MSTQEQLSKGPGAGQKPSAPAAGHPTAKGTNRVKQRKVEAPRELPTRPRRYGQLVAVIVVMAACALAAGLVLQRAGDTTSVIAARDGIAKGEVIDRADLVSKEVSGLEEAIPVNDLDQLVGKTAAVDLLGGQVITRSAATSAMVPGKGKTLVGFALDPSRIPDGLTRGDTVRVLVVPAGDAADTASGLDDPKVLADDATVYSVHGVATEGGAQRLTLVIPEQASDQAAAYGSADRVAVVEAAPSAATGEG